MVYYSNKNRDRNEILRESSLELQGREVQSGMRSIYILSATPPWSLGNVRTLTSLRLLKFPSIMISNSSFSKMKSFSATLQRQPKTSGASGCNWQHTHWWYQFHQTVFAATVATIISITGPSNAEIVRVEDVESPTLQAGLLAANEGRLEVAERFFNLYLKEEPGSASGWSNLANIHLQFGQLPLAEEEFTKSIQLSNSLAPVPLLNRALARQAIGVQLRNDGQIEKSKDMFEMALRDCEKSVELDPKEFAAYYNKSNIEMEVGDYSAALVSATKAADLAPGLPGYRLREGILLFQEGKVTESQRLIKSVVRKTPIFAEAFAALSAVQWSVGDGAGAEDSYNRCRLLDTSWGDKTWVESHTRWPPLLRDAYYNFLTLN